MLSDFGIFELGKGAFGDTCIIDGRLPHCLTGSAMLGEEGAMGMLVDEIGWKRGLDDDMGYEPR